MESISEVAARLLETVDMVIKDEPKEASTGTRDAIRRGAKLAIEHWQANTGLPIRRLAERLGTDSTSISRLLNKGMASATGLYLDVCAAAGIDWEAAMAGRVEPLSTPVVSRPTTTTQAGGSTAAMLAKLIGTPHEETIRVIMEDLLNRNN